MSRNDLVKEIVGGEVLVVHKRVAERFGINAALFLRELSYWSERSEDGWVYRTRDDLMSATTLTRRNQETARRYLVDAGVIEEELRGIPAQLFYRIDWDVLSVNFHRTNLEGGNDPTSRAESAQQAGTNPPDYIKGESQASNQENKPVSPISPISQPESFSLGDAGKREKHGAKIKSTEAAVKAQKAARKAELTVWFEEWWDMWPNKLAKGDAWQEFERLSPDRELMARIGDKTEEWVNSWDWTKDNGAFVPRADKWLRGKRWEDPAPRPEPNGGAVGGFSYSEDGE